MKQRSRTLAHPEPGYFSMRLGKGARLVAARIYRPCPMVEPCRDVMIGGIVYPDIEPGEVCAADWCRPLDRSRPLRADIAGKPCDPLKIWENGTFSTRAEWEYLTADLEWAKKYAPDTPQARPTQAIDLGKQPSLF